MASRSLRARLRDYGTQAFGIDLRALAAFRIALGLTLLGSVASTALDFELLLTGGGVLPARAVWPPASVPLLDPEAFYAIVDAPAFVVGLLAAMAVAAVCLTAGRFTWSATLCLWIGMSFLVRRNPFVQNAAHSMTLFTLLWSLFLPLGALGSLDRLRGRAPRGLPLQYLSPATAGLVLQVVFVYVTAALAKRGPEWHAAGSAIFIVAHQERYQTPFTPLLAALPAPALATLAHLVWRLEALAPLLLLWPLPFAPVRCTGVLLLIALHLGMGTFMRLGAFPWICITYLIALLPGAFFDRLLPRSRSAVGGEGAAPGRRGPAGYALQAAAVLLVVCTLVNYLRLVPGLEGNAPAWLRQMGGELHIGRVYRLFSALGFSTSRYLVLGQLADGSRVDLLTREPAQITWDAARISIAPDGSERFPWIDYSGRLEAPNFHLKAQAPHYAAYFCRSLAEGAAPLERVEIYQLGRLLEAGSAPTLVRKAYELPCREPLP